MIQDILNRKYGESLDQLWIKENDFGLVLSAIVINKDARNSGIGSKVMTDLIEYSEQQNKIIALTPSNSYGGSKGRLISFYKSFGFAMNKGGNKDFRFMETMIRYPSTMNEDKIPGGLAQGKDLTDIANKHKVDIDELTKQYQKGIKVEMEHTSDRQIACEISKDHLFEDPKYYDKLETIEESKLNIKSLFREHVESTIVDESPDTVQVLVKYNQRNAGVISVTAANAKDTMEIVGVEFKPDYHTLFILNQAVKSLWQIFSGTNSLIVAPKPEGIEAWNKLGFQRISKNYLILNRGH
jgi:hypothetical protein